MQQVSRITSEPNQTFFQPINRIEITKSIYHVRPWLLTIHVPNSAKYRLKLLRQAKTRVTRVLPLIKATNSTFLKIREEKWLCLLWYVNMPIISKIFPGSTCCRFSFLLVVVAAFVDASIFLERARGDSATPLGRELTIFCELGEGAGNREGWEFGAPYYLRYINASRFQSWTRVNLLDLLHSCSPNTI